MSDAFSPTSFAPRRALLSGLGIERIFREVKPFSTVKWRCFSYLRCPLHSITHVSRLKTTFAPPPELLRRSKVEFRLRRGKTASYLFRDLGFLEAASPPQSSPGAGKP